MAITEAYSGTETVTTTEWSMTTDTSGPDAETADGVYQIFIDASALVAGDVFEFTAYEKVLAASTQRKFFVATISGVQATPNIVSPSFILMHGWDFTLKKTAGTDRSISWSIRKIA
jgi:hypothetical protein